jgi:hypothetical protein
MLVDGSLMCVDKFLDCQTDTLTERSRKICLPFAAILNGLEKEWFPIWLDRSPYARIEERDNGVKLNR